MSTRALKLCAAALLAFWLNLQPAAAQKVPVVEKTLSNGMRLLMVQRHDEPSISGGWVARVGSVNERPGITGIAHLFEHMMFKGTPSIGTKDYQKDLEIITAQERVREQMRQEERKMREAWRRGEIDDLQKPENQTERYRELEKQFKQLIEQQREILVKNEFDKIYTAAGGSGMNAFTSYDMTAYFITVPANRLEFWMWMESERLLRPVFREFYAERDVVFEERRMRTESTPLGKFEEQFEAMFWTSHPYGWPVIGWPSDIPAITKAQADEFYDTYYAPQNLTLILIGDFQQEEAVTLAEKYFSRIPRGKKEAPDVVTLEIPQVIEKRLFAEAEVTPQADILWHTVPFGHPDSHALQVLAQILSTRTGRLYKGLVLGSGVATDAFARQDSRKYAGAFNAGGEARDGYKPEDVEQGIYAEIDKLKNELVPEQELQKVKNNFAAQEYRRLTSNHAILFQLIFNEGLGDWSQINEAGPKIQKVTAEDVQRIARRYFTSENRAVAIYTRKTAKPAGEDAELAGLSEEQKSVIRMIATRIKAETSLDKLKETLQTIEAQAAKADAKNRIFYDMYRKRIEQRVVELEKGNK